jgi:hypothetical protein
MAMKIAGKYKFKEVSLRHWSQLAQDIGLRPDYVLKQFHLLAGGAQTVAQTLAYQLNQDPRTASPLYEQIVQGIGLRSRLIYSQTN